MMKYILLGSLVCFISRLYGQRAIDFEHYESLVCEGQIPADFKINIMKLTGKMENAGTSSKARVDKLKADHIEWSNYVLNNILYSGRILYGDELSSYVNRVADRVLQSEPELRQKLRFYVLKSAEVNAHCFDMGFVFIDIGLLSQIDDEAELAFIICHEAIHFRNNHHFDSYSRKHSLESERNGFVNNEAKMRQLLDYEKEQELEADREGLKIFLKSPYSSANIDRTFDMLSYSYMPYDDIAFNNAYFDDKFYRLPTEFFLSKVKPIVSREKLEDAESTHPNINKRKTIVLRALEETEARQGYLYGAGEEEFENIQHMARCELVQINLRDGEFPEAFYNAYLLEKTYGKNFYSDKIMASALYAIAKIKNNVIEKERLKRDKGVRKRYEFPENPLWKKVEGESQAVHYLFYSLPAVDMNVLAAKKMYEYKALYNDAYFALRFNELAGELIRVHGVFRSDFLSANRDSIKMPAKDSTISSRYGQLVAGQKKIFYYNYAFNDNLKDKYFRSVFNRQEDIQDSIKKADADKNTLRFKRHQRVILSQNGPALGVNNAVFIMPNYSDYTYRFIYTDSVNYYYTVRNKRTRPVKEMMIEKEIGGYIRRYSGDLGMNIEILGRNANDSIDTREFNKFQQMIAWTYEKFAMGQFNSYTFSHERMPFYCGDSHYIGFFRITKEYKYTQVSFILLDMQTGAIVSEYSKELFKVKPESLQMRSVIYEILDHLHQSPDKINSLKKKYNIHD